MSYRTPEIEAEYEKHKKLHRDMCNFCRFDSEGADQVIKTYRYFYLVTNIFPYSHWDRHAVVDHLMLVPKQHIVSLKSLTATEGKEFFEIVSDYESKGYSLYARTDANATKTVAHQHTHLIKLSSKL